MSKLSTLTPVAIQGLAGCNHDLATQYFFDKPQIKSCMDFDQVFTAVKSGEVEYGVVAFENSTIGSINKVYDLLKHSGVHIVAELYLRIGHHLMGLPGAKLADIRSIYSMGLALDQCQNALRKLAQKQQLDLHERADTAESAQYVAGLGDKTAAALAPLPSASQYELKVLKKGMENEYHNYTRFIVLSHKSSVKNGANKTSVILKTAHHPGALYSALGCFAKRNINLSKLVSRPIAGNLSKYCFYIDFEAGVHSSEAKAALQELKKLGNTVTILGSYRKGKVIL